MSLKDQSTLRVVFFEGDGAQPMPAADRFDAMTALLQKGFAEPTGRYGHYRLGSAVPMLARRQERGIA